MHQLENDLREKLKLDGVLSEKKKVPSAGDDFPEIPERGIVLIERRWGAGAMDKVFSKGFRVEITRKDLRTLKGLDWLNNEVINFYTGSICERSASSNNEPYSIAGRTRMLKSRRFQRISTVGLIRRLISIPCRILSVLARFFVQIIKHLLEIFSRIGDESDIVGEPQVPKDLFQSSREDSTLSKAFSKSTRTMNSGKR
ncbi:hypothetical protein QR680_013166 [Steinernema hermaphroditum]|uniref:Uncharacterized protein n=1 Tax=Steinernema hermaphroditum TaxID=289476 RepID=A0AA39I7D9_9BILA|nr:hypothetical protein QR680_013166 [Steinernema hermaphroditum]